MIDRVDARFGLYPEKLAADAANGAAEMLSWLVRDKGIEPNIQVIDHSQRDDGTFSRADLTYDHDKDLYRCPEGKVFLPIQRQAGRRPYSGLQDGRSE